MGDHNPQQSPWRPEPPARSRSAYDITVSEPLSKDEFEQRSQYFSDLADKLKASVTGEVFVRTESRSQVDKLPKGKPAASGFGESTTLFNAAAPLAAWMVARPTSSEDVVRYVA